MIDELDWNRLRSGDLRALNPDHQDVFNMVFDLQAEIERLRKSLDDHLDSEAAETRRADRERDRARAAETEIERLRDIIYRASKEWQSLNKEADDEIKRLRDYIAKMERGYKHFRDTAEAEYARLHTEIEQLRMVTAPGSCECSPEEACRYARERDDARAEIERLREALVKDDGGRMAYQNGWDNREPEIQRLRDLLREWRDRGKHDRFYTTDFEKRVREALEKQC